jgi:hypothetical protein
VAEQGWQEQWRAIMRGFMAVGRVNSGQHLDHSSEQLFYDFCRDCYQLRHCLETDPAVAAAVQRDVQVHIANSPCITLAGAVAHPQYVGQTVIRPVSEQNPPRMVMRIEWDKPDGTTGSEDAFGLAAGAVGEWRTFLTRHSLI